MNAGENVIFDEIEVGDRVYSERYGEGVVSSKEIIDTLQLFEVEFENSENYYFPETAKVYLTFLGRDYKKTVNTSGEDSSVNNGGGIMKIGEKVIFDEIEVGDVVESESFGYGIVMEKFKTIFTVLFENEKSAYSRYLAEHNLKYVGREDKNTSDVVEDNPKNNGGGIMKIGEKVVFEELEIGDRVKSEQYGEGVVYKKESFIGDEIIRVKFESSESYYFPAKAEFCLTFLGREDKNTSEEDNSVNNGGSTDYYKLPAGAKDVQDLIEYKNMNFAIGNCFKALYRLGDCNHSDKERDLNKIIWFAQRELNLLKKKGE